MLAIERCTPATMSSFGTFLDNREMTSDSAKTVQVLLTGAGFCDLKYQSPISDIGISNTLDMTSRKRPVPGELHDQALCI